MQYDALIVGGGLVGATTALALGSQGHRVAVFDAGEPQQVSETLDLRVVALSMASIEWLQFLGVWSALDSTRIGRFDTLSIQDHDAHLTWDGASKGLAQLGCIVENKIIVEAAQQACIKHENIDTFFSTQLEALAINDESVLTSGDKSWAGRLLIGADGARSWVREQLGVNCFTHDYQQKALVCHVEMEKAHQFCAWQNFLENGPIAFLPLAHSHQASIVWTLPTQKAQSLQNEDPANLAQAIAQAAGQHYGRVSVISDVASFPLRLQHANEYSSKGVVMIGDAIHSIHPLAGQGVNLGFADAQTLVRMLRTTSSQHWHKPRFLKRFERERKGPNLMMAHAMTGFNELFKYTTPAFVKARQMGLQIYGTIPPLKSATLAVATGR